MASRFRNATGYALISFGIAGVLLPVIPGIPLIIAGAAVLGKDHRLVRSCRSWLAKKGFPGGEEDRSVNEAVQESSSAGKASRRG
jgi:hypothetical protein